MTLPTFKKIKIEAYKPGRSFLKKTGNAIKLSANESALGFSPKVKKVLQRKNIQISRYPDSKAIELRKLISKKFKCDFNKTICGSGSDEVIQMLCQLFLKLINSFLYKYVPVGLLGFAIKTILVFLLTFFIIASTDILKFFSLEKTTLAPTMDE